MKLRSFRLRIALLSTFLAGSGLAGFSSVCWWQIYQDKLTRLDSQLQSQFLQNMTPPKPPDIQSFESEIYNREYWNSQYSKYKNSLQSIFGNDAQTLIALLVIDVNGKVVYKSQYWPSDLNQASLFSSEPPLTRPPAPPDEHHVPPPGEEHKPPPRQKPEEFSDEALPFNFPPLPPTSDVPDKKPEPELAKFEKRSGTWHVYKVQFPIRMAIAGNLQIIDREMTPIRNVFLSSIPVVLILVAIGAWGLSGSALGPIREVTATIRRVTAKGLNQRIPTSETDVEFVELLQVFNQMMERLERSFNQASRFSGDAAHELKTPLAILQGELERTLQQVDPGSELQQRLSDLLDEVCRLGSIVRKLLLLSLADAGQMRLYRVDVDLSKVLADLADDIEMLAPDLEVKTQIAPSLRVQGDQDLLIQVLQNLIGNAIKYNLPEGWVGIDARRKDAGVSVTVSNRSNDIPANERERIFDRFYRGDPAHTRNVEGLGLGLSLSREIARAHGGDLKLDHTPTGQTAFTLTLPIH